MVKNSHFGLLVAMTALVLSACSFPPTQTPTEPPPNPLIPDSETASTLVLTKVADTSVPFNTVGQVINYTYQIKNAGVQSLPGPVNLVDNKTTPTCPDLTSVGNGDSNLDANEEITCIGSYVIVQADLDAGTVTNNATATVGGVISNPALFTVNLTQNRALTLSKAANPQTYNQVGDVINYTYVILNSGDVAITGQVNIADDKTVATCTQPADGVLSPNEEMSCIASYTITQADLDAGSVTNNASASDGVTTSNNATTIVSKSGVINPNPNLTPGDTIQHPVVSGEWLWQIARCYGANPKDVINANTQLPNPAIITSGITVTVPNIGSRGTIYGSPCVRLHTVQAGDTWSSIAQQYSADVNLLQKANPGGLFTGRQVKVPVGTLP